LFNFLANSSIVNAKALILVLVMQLIPILEIRHGKSVHTKHGVGEQSHVVTDDPMETVANWQAKGIKRVHFVDVDAVESGEPRNVNLLRNIKLQYPDLLVQVIGGIKSVDSAFIWMDAGADYLTLNGKALRRKNLLSDLSVEYPQKILVEVDSHHGNVRMGNDEQPLKLIDLARKLDDDGIAGLVVTEVPSKGHVTNKDLLTINQLSQEIEISIFANGGIDSLSDLENLFENHAEKLAGVILGKVVHHKDFCLSQAQELLAKYKLAN